MKRVAPLALMLFGMIAAAFALSATAASPALGQAVPRQLPPDPPPELPSVSDYSLPPGQSAAPANQAEGPVEENALPPQAAPSPDIAAPAPVRSVPEIVTDPTNTAENQPNPADNAQPRRPVTASPRALSPPPATISPPATNPAADGPPASTSPPQPGFSTDISGEALPSDPSAIAAEPEEVAVSSPSPEAGFGGDILYYIVGGIVLLLLGRMGAYLWRRKTSALSNDEMANEELAQEEAAYEDTDAADPAPAPEPQPMPAPRKPAPKIYSPPDPVEPKKPSPVHSSGFVTSKIGVIPEPPTATDAIPPETPKRTVPTTSTLAEHFQIDFVATGASFTLMNAVLNYAVTLTNISDDDLHDIHLSGAMMQADTETARKGSADNAALLHKVTSLSAGETVTLTGDIRLPLNAIRPITFKSQALFVPLARFAVAFVDDKAVTLHQTASFIIGREYEPPRPKMAPFRLDLGPRSFSPVGQRPLLTS